MITRSALWRSASLGLLLLAGCLYPVRQKIDEQVCDLAGLPRDIQPLTPADQLTPMPPAQDPQDPPITPIDFRQPAGSDRAGSDELTFPRQLPETAPPGKGRGREPPRLLTPPPDLLPRGYTPPLRLPSRAELDKLPPAVREEVIRQWHNYYYQPLPTLGPDPQPIKGPEGRPLTLADLQRLALSNSPLIRQAAANVQAMRGAAIQQGLPPNPTVGYEGDTAGTTGGAGYQGGFVDQVFPTANKLQLARAVATIDYRNAQLALRRAETDLMTRVRTGYFALLVAQESLRVNRALTHFATQVYNNQVEMLRGGFAALYEPMYLRVLAMQARAALVQARTAYVSAWKTLAADMGLPGMPLTELAGRIDLPIPVYDYQKVLAYVLANHTDVRTAANTLQQARLNLRVAQVTPIPNVEVRFLLQKDFTGPPFELAHSLQVIMPIPVWNRNQGGIMQAEAGVAHDSEEPHRVRNALTARLAYAFQSYQSYRIQTAMYRDQILPDQFRVYTGVYERYRTGEPAPPPNLPPTALTPAPGFNDVVVAQQILTTGVTSYITNLGLMWQAVVEVTDLLQTDDMFRIDGELQPTQEVCPIPDLDKLLPRLPCCHPCSPLPAHELKKGDGGWPPPLPPGPAARPMPSAEEEAERAGKHPPIPPSLAPPARPTPPPPGGPAVTAPAAPAPERPAALPPLSTGPEVRPMPAAAEATGRARTQSPAPPEFSPPLGPDLPPLPTPPPDRPAVLPPPGTLRSPAAHAPPATGTDAQLLEPPPEVPRRSSP